MTQTCHRPEAATTTVPAVTATPVPGPAAPATPAATVADLYAEHRVGLLRLALLLVDDSASAEDVVQEAFTGLHRRWGSLKDVRAAVGYLHRAVVNGSRSVLRRRRTARAYSWPQATPVRSAESLAMLAVEHQAVVSAMAELAPRQREVLVLRYYSGLSETEIAGVVGISSGTVKSTAHRGLANLRGVLDRRGR